MTTTATHCPYCALQCAMTLAPDRPDEAGAGVSVAGRDFPTNNGRLCRKGFSAPELLASRQRITAPLLRGDDGGFHEAGWDEVLDLLAGKIAATRAEHGPDAIAVFGAGGLTNEKAYQLGKFARLALGTRLIDYNGRFCMSSAAAAGNRSFGLDRGLPFPLTDLREASAILMLGSNVADTMPPFVQHLEAARAAGGLIVVDPRGSATASLTDDAGGLHLQPAPGTDLELLLGLAHVVLTEDLADLDYLAERTSGLPALRRTLAPWWPERTEQVTGVPAAQIRRAAHHLGNAARQARDAVVRGEAPAKVFVLTGRGVEQHVGGTDTTTAAVNLALLLGLPGTLGGGFGTLTGQGNGQGGREHGQKSDQLPGYRRIDDPAARAHVAAAWGVDEPLIPGPGIPAAQLLYSLGGSNGGTLPDGAPGPRVLMVHGSNVAVSAPDSHRVIAGLRRLDFLVVADFFLSETAAEADLVLPVLQWAEEEGTMTSLEGRILRRRRALTPPPGARDELWIMAELARRLDAPGTYSTDAREVFDELRAASAGGPADYSGVDYADLDAGRAVYWPFPAAEHDGAAAPAAHNPPPAPAAPDENALGTPRLFLERFAHPDGLAKLVPVRPAPAPPGDAAGLRRPGGGGSHPDGDPSALALTVITGRLLEHYQSGAQTRRTGELLAAAPEARAEIHPATAAQLGLEDGGWIELRNNQGVVVVRCRYSAAMRTDAVFVPFHYPGAGSVNRLVTGATDPISSMPAFKNALVTARAGTDPRAGTSASADKTATGVQI
ncbi:molybdopterin oxidoreductase family protein [Zhihengliuella salsuginis]|uniref:Molybdopterin oxidoreductase n=1 Tax=Zhihengliuella salsuginis TaxID=578222 RepID=A0ABQ3GG91_9MICC|nr:molybdopterin oxidoreductase family protein [Zhihengliuella salsuginis]GHD04939.1 molybdopterin oxidoreductase [Zhihengliuella salsuginis]